MGPPPPHQNGESSKVKIPPWYSFHSVNVLKLYTTPISSNILCGVCVFKGFFFLFFFCLGESFGKIVM